jgi:hypothetical protein
LRRVAVVLRRRRRLQQRLTAHGEIDGVGVLGAAALFRFRLDELVA